MYPESFLMWLIGMAVIFGLLGLIIMMVFFVDKKVAKHQERKGKKHGWWHEDGWTRLRIVFEALSAILVITSLLVAIYSDSQLLRAIAGIALIVVVSTATYLWLDQT